MVARKHVRRSGDSNLATAASRFPQKDDAVGSDRKVALDLSKPVRLATTTPHGTRKAPSSSHPSETHRSADFGGSIPSGTWPVGPVVGFGDGALSFVWS